MSNLPRYLLRNCTLWADRESKLGQIGDITLPAPKVKTEEMRNAGMIKPREVNLGYEMIETGFKMPGLDPQVMKLFGLKPGSETLLMITGALVDEEGATHSAVAIVRGFMKEANNGDWKPGEVSENEFTFAVHYYKLEIDGNVIIEMDDFDVSIGGVSQYQDIRNAMLV